MTAHPGAPAPTRKLVSLIVPAYDEAGNVAGLVEFVRAIRRAHPDLDFELILVDDGSTDGTAGLVLAALDERDLARVASLSRNFGSHAAISAGLALARGDCALTLSADLQESLETVSDFIGQWRAGNDVVWGIRRTRAVPKGLANWLSRRFSAVFHRMSDIPSYPRQGPSHVLVGRPVIDTITAMPERNRNVLGMIAWAGFRQTTIEFDQLPRPTGQSKWTTAKKVRLVVDSFVEFSSAPFLFTLLAGLAIGAAGLLLGLGVLLTALITLSAPVGWALVVATVLAVGGMNLVVLGGFGEYLWRAGDDARRRPVFVLNGVCGHGQPPVAEPGRAAAVDTVTADAVSPVAAR